MAGWDIGIVGPIEGSQLGYGRQILRTRVIMRCGKENRANENAAVFGLEAAGRRVGRLKAEMEAWRCRIKC